MPSQRRATPDMSSFVVDSGLISGADASEVRRKPRRSPSPSRAEGSSASLTTSASSPTCRHTRTSMPSTTKQSPSSSPSPPQQRQSPQDIELQRARQYHTALTKDLSSKLEAEGQLSSEEVALLQRSVVEIKAPSWEEEREEERRDGNALSPQREEAGAEQPAPVSLPKIGNARAVGRHALKIMAAAAAETKTQVYRQHQGKPGLAVGDYGAPKPYSLVSTLSAQLLPPTPGVTPAALAAFKGGDFVKPHQGPAPPAQRWLREVASEATLRMQPQRRRSDHGDLLAPLRAALAVLRNECEAEDARARRQAIEEGRADDATFHPARERLSATAKGAGMEWRRVQARAQPPGCPPPLAMPLPRARCPCHTPRCPCHHAPLTRNGRSCTRRRTRGWCLASASWTRAWGRRWPRSSPSTWARCKSSRS